YSAPTYTSSTAVYTHLRWSVLRIHHEPDRNRNGATEAELADRKQQAQHHAGGVSTTGRDQRSEPDAWRKSVVGFRQTDVRHLGLRELPRPARGVADTLLLERARLGQKRPRVSMERVRLVGHRASEYVGLDGSWGRYAGTGSGRG